MLKFEEIRELIELVATHRLSGFELERSGFRLKIDGQRPGQTAGPTAPAETVPPASAAAVAPSPVAETEPENGDGLPAGTHLLKSPIVGTFYRRPNPEADPYVEVGDRVKVGQVLCIVEAMKLMNEIECDIDGVIVEVFPKNAQAVEFGEPLFAINPA